MLSIISFIFCTLSSVPSIFVVRDRGWWVQVGCEHVSSWCGATVSRLVCWISAGPVLESDTCHSGGEACGDAGFDWLLEIMRAAMVYSWKWGELSWPIPTLIWCMCYKIFAMASVAKNRWFLQIFRDICRFWRYLCIVFFCMLALHLIFNSLVF